jgi:hypothetical protein
LLSLRGNQVRDLRIATQIETTSGIFLSPVGMGNALMLA